MANIKTDCFAYREGRKCNALSKLYCEFENCKFYKTKQQRCAECEKTRTRITCGECVTNKWK